MKNDNKPDYEHGLNKIAEAICGLTCAISAGVEQQKTEFEWAKSHHGFATKIDLVKMETNIMSAISEFAAKQKVFNDRQAVAVDGLVADVASLNAKIEELQNSPGSITPEDQALLDEIETRSDAITTKLEALDAQTPPVVPPTP